MEFITFIIGCFAGYLVSTMINRRIIKRWLIGRLKIVWDRDEHQPYMFMELANPDITDVTNRDYVILKVDDEIKFSQK